MGWIAVLGGVREWQRWAEAHTRDGDIISRTRCELRKPNGDIYLRIKDIEQAQGLVFSN